MHLLLFFPSSPSASSHGTSIRSALTGFLERSEAKPAVHQMHVACGRCMQHHEACNSTKPKLHRILFSITACCETLPDVEDQFPDVYTVASVACDLQPWPRHCLVEVHGQCGSGGSGGVVFALYWKNVLEANGVSCRSASIDTHNLAFKLPYFCILHLGKRFRQFAFSPAIAQWLALMHSILASTAETWQ